MTMPHKHQTEQSMSKKANDHSAELQVACDPGTRAHNRYRLAFLFPHGLTPGGLALRGALLVMFFLALHLSGLRAYTTVLTGTSPTGEPLNNLSFALGGLYVLAWFGFTLAAPILLIAAGLLWGWTRMRHRS
jgi:hypothetical protein